MRKKILSTLVLLTLGLGRVYADDAVGFNMDIDIDVNALSVKMSRFSDEDQRPGKHGTNLAIFAPTGWDYLTDDAKIKFGYEGNVYGGFLRLDKAGLSGVKTWIKFGQYLRLTAGNDIESVYAEALDADPGLRVYYGILPSEWDAHINPDNITQDQGLLLESFFGPVTAALAGNYHIANVISRAIPNTNRTQWEDTNDREFQYGARVGSELGDLGKVNVSYMLRYKKIANNYNFNRDQDMVAIAADAEVFSHLFGVYGSLKPSGALEVTLGYGGIITKYLDEFYRTTGTVKTLVPLILQNGINLNARYKGIPGLTIRTDHNFSFWKDRDYRTFGVTGWDNIGLSSQTTSTTSAEIQHWLLWNGLGVIYDLTDQVTGSIYLRNLYRNDNVRGTGGIEYKLTKDMVVLEPKVTWKLGGHAEIFAGITWEMTITTASTDLNRQGLNTFVSGIDAKKTADTEHLIKIPMGITMTF